MNSVVINADPTGSPVPAGCRGCRFYADCGGLPEQDALWGCFTDCETACRRHECDWTCPARGEVFIDRWREVGGWGTWKPATLQAFPALDLPCYLPMIQHGARRDVPLTWPVVALPTFRVIRRLRGGRYGAHAMTAQELRQEFQLAPETSILLVSVARDKHLEAYWRYRNSYAVAEHLASLDVIGLTIPNFSFFSDAPRTHTLWNRTRMIRVAEELSQVGIGVAPHVNALTPADWEFWAQVLKSQLHLQHVTKEFQTGLARKDAGLDQLNALRRLQDRVGRDLHPIAVGAARLAPDLAKAFRRFTIVDSEPFMATMYRRGLHSRGRKRPRELKEPTEPGASLDAVLSHNLQVYDSWVQQASGLTSIEASGSEVSSRNTHQEPILSAQQQFSY